MINVDITKTLQENLKNVSPTQIKSMLQSLQSDSLPPHVRLQYLYNLRHLDSEVSLKEHCTNYIELSVIGDAQYHGQTLQQLLINSSFEYMRPIPQPLKSTFQDIQQTINFQVQWETVPIFDCLCLLAQSQKLSNAEHTLFLQKYKYDKIDAPQFKLLVEHNPNLVSELIAKSHHQGINIFEYLNYLIQIKMSIQTLEIVNLLSKSIQLPDQFLNMFITKCIEACEELKNNQQQPRQVRLVAAFIRNLIKLKTFDPKKIYAELQGFCLENLNIQEAAQLFKIIKSSVQEQ